MGAFRDRRLLLSLLLAVGVICSSACYSQPSFNQHVEKRRQGLLEMYPVYKTTRKDVAAHWYGPPLLQKTRPAKGWQAEANREMREYSLQAEKRIGKRIASTECYYGADGIFSLCYCWYFYDSSDRLLDATWQKNSD